MLWWSTQADNGAKMLMLEHGDSLSPLEAEALRKKAVGTLPGTGRGGGAHSPDPA